MRCTETIVRSGAILEETFIYFITTFLFFFLNPRVVHVLVSHDATVRNCAQLILCSLVRRLRRRNALRPLGDK